MDISILKRFFSGTDFLRPNRYSVEFHTGFANFSNDMRLLCRSVSFPFYTFNTINSFVNNRNNSVIDKVDFDPVTFGFYVDADKRILNFINDWKNVIMDQHFQYGYKDEYTADIDITLLHLHDSEVASCRLVNAFLVNVDNIELSSENRDAVSKISFSVQYDSIQYNNDIFDFRTFLKHF